MTEFRPEPAFDPTVPMAEPDEVGRQLLDRLSQSGYFDGTSGLLDQALVMDAAYTVAASVHHMRPSPVIAPLHRQDRRLGTRLATPPACYGYVPVAYNESEFNIRHTLNNAAAQTIAPEVFLHGNFPGDIGEAELAQFITRISRITESYARVSGLSAVRSVVTESPTPPGQPFSMTRLRKQGVDALAADAAGRRLPFTTPVAMLDADMLDASRNSLEDLTEPIRTGAVPLTYANSDYGLRDQQDNDATRLAVASEAVRRLEVHANQATEPYPEECGTAFSIGAYCLTGFNIARRSAQTPGLIERLNATIQSGIYQQVMSTMFTYPAGHDHTPGQVAGARVLLDNRRSVEYFRRLIIHANAHPESVEATNAAVASMDQPPAVDRRIATGGHYEDLLGSDEAMRSESYTPSSTPVMEPRARTAILQFLFGPHRLQPISISDTPALIAQKEFIAHYLGGN